MLDSAKNAGFDKKKRLENQDTGANNVTGKFKQPWFNQNCHKVRKKFRNAKNNYIRRKTSSNKMKMVRSGRNYKLYLKRCRYNYYKNLGLKLRDLKSKNSKQFWKIIDNKNNSNNVNANFDDLFEHFKNLNATDPDESSLPNTQSNSNSIINNDFTEDEICNGIKKLKCNKACGIDNIANEFIIDSCNMIAPTITKLFNIILETGLIPQKWCIGIITPIFKNKGSAENPENYRGISILSCFSKLFTLLINERLTLYLDDLGIIGENQTGFRSNYSTLDHIFSLKSIIDFYLNKRKKTFLCLCRLQESIRHC